MKRIGSVLITGACTLLMAACGSTSEPEQSAVPVIPTEASTAVAAVPTGETEVQSDSDISEEIETEGSEVATVTSVPATATVPPAATATPSLKELLPSQGLAPEINNEIWINSDQPLRLEELRGQVVLIEFWTYG